MYVEPGALEYFAQLLADRSLKVRLWTYVGSFTDGGKVYISLSHHKHPDNYEVPSPAKWESAARLFNLLLSPQSQINEAKKSEFPNSVNVEITGYAPVEDIQEMSQQAIASFRASTLSLNDR